VLKPGGRAVIHHPGAASAGRSSAWRADTTDEMIVEFCRENGLRLVAQSTELVNQGDVLSIIDKAA
jgi:predicted methyltransferase